MQFGFNPGQLDGASNLYLPAIMILVALGCMYACCGIARRWPGMIQGYIVYAAISVCSVVATFVFLILVT